MVLLLSGWLRVLGWAARITDHKPEYCSALSLSFQQVTLPVHFWVILIILGQIIFPVRLANTLLHEWRESRKSKWDQGEIDFLISPFDKTWAEIFKYCFVVCLCFFFFLLQMYVFNYRIYLSYLPQKWVISWKTL